MEYKKDKVELHAFHDSFDSFTQDLLFKKGGPNGRNLVFSMNLDGGESQGTVTIRNQKWGGSKVETLSLFDNKGDQIGKDMSLRSIFLQATNEFKSFKRTEFQDAFGYLAIPS